MHHLPRITFLVAVTLYAIFLHVTYVLIVSPEFSYLGFTYHPANLYVLIGCSAIAVAPALWIPLRITRPSEFASAILYFIVVIPSCVIPLYTISGDLHIIIIASLMVGCFALLNFLQRLPLVHLPNLEVPVYAYWLAIFALAMVCSACIALTFGFTFRLPSLTEVYDVRDEYKRASSAGVIEELMAYVMAWTTNVLNPLLIIRGILGRQTLWLVAGIGGQLFIYSITAYKHGPFSVLFIIGIIFIMRMRYPTISLLYFLLTVCIASASIDLLSDSGTLTSLFVRRVLMIPGLLTGYYWDFFSSHQLYLLSHSLLGPFITCPYSQFPPDLIGDRYIAVGCHANAHIWADGYCNFGIAGMVGATVLLAAVFWLYDSISQERDLRSSCVLIAMSTVALSNAALLTCLLSHGLLLVLVLWYLSPTECTIVPPSDELLTRDLKWAADLRATPIREGTEA